MTRKLAKKKNMNTELLPSMMLDLQNLVWHLKLFRLNQRKVRVYFMSKMKLGWSLFWVAKRCSFQELGGRETGGGGGCCLVFISEYHLLTLTLMLKVEEEKKRKLLK